MWSADVDRRVCRCEQRLEQLPAISVERSEHRRERRACVVHRTESGVVGHVDLSARGKVGSVLPGVPHLRGSVAGRGGLARHAAHHAAVVVRRTLRRDIVHFRSVLAVHVHLVCVNFGAVERAADRVYPPWRTRAFRLMSSSLSWQS